MSIIRLAKIRSPSSRSKSGAIIMQLNFPATFSHNNSPYGNQCKNSYYCKYKRQPASSTSCNGGGRKFMNFSIKRLIDKNKIVRWLIQKQFTLKQKSYIFTAHQVSPNNRKEKFLSCVMKKF